MPETAARLLRLLVADHMHEEGAKDRATGGLNQKTSMGSRE